MAFNKMGGNIPSDKEVNFIFKKNDKSSYDTNIPIKLHSEYQPSGDQPQAIEKLVEGLKEGKKDQVLLGVTGSGKTFTMANVIERMQRPTLIMAPNKTLAAQLFNEIKEFFPENAVEYFVSFYDYYQPEAYVAKTDTFIEKDSSINDEIDRMRHRATRSLLERGDVIIVSSVSCIYGIGDIETYSEMVIELSEGGVIDMSELCKQLTELQYERKDINFIRGTFRVAGDTLDVFPVHLENYAWKISFFGDEIESIYEFDPLTGERKGKLNHVKIFANSHYVTPRPTVNEALKHIKQEMVERVKHFEDNDKLIEAQRIGERVKYDLEMLASTGYCNGIENYSRYLTGREIGSPPPTIFEYLPEDALLIMDESHVSVSQVGAMYKGDASRKQNLSDYGFRLPSCKDNRPLKFEEWDKLRPQTVFVSATPNDWELKLTGGEFVEQLIRPTSLVDPECEIRPTEFQVDDIISESLKTIENDGRVIIITLTKKNAEDLTEYMTDAGIKVSYLHSDVDTLERIEIIRNLRLGKIDVLIGINLLREGIDIPECKLVGILDSDKEGFLRSKTSLIQTIGRAARNQEGKVILYADSMTGSMQYALSETERRRNVQIKFNEDNGLKPRPIIKSVAKSMIDNYEEKKNNIKTEDDKKIYEIIKSTKLLDYIPKLRDRMRKCAEELDFEEAVKVRDEIEKLSDNDMSSILLEVSADIEILKSVYLKN